MKIMRAIVKATMAQYKMTKFRRISASINLQCGSRSRLSAKSGILSAASVREAR